MRDLKLLWINCDVSLFSSIASGVQGPEHPHTGRAFFAVGFPRKCYLPDCPLGRKVLRYLKIAFDRRLLFSIGRSATTGREDVVVWNSVDHKTQYSMYPDPGYLQRCLTQLTHLGVADWERSKGNQDTTKVFIPFIRQFLKVLNNCNMSLIKTLCTRHFETIIVVYFCILYKFVNLTLTVFYPLWYS